MRILLLHCRGIPPASFYQEFHHGLTEALRESGHHPVEFSFAALGQPPVDVATDLYRAVTNGNFAAVIDLACWGYGLSKVAVPGGSARALTPIWHALRVPYFAWLFDHPWNQALNAIEAAELFAVYPDQDHLELAPLIFPGLASKNEVFAPPAVRAASGAATLAPQSGRGTDVLYVGNLVPEATERFWRLPNHRLWNGSQLPEFCDALADAMLSTAERPLHSHLRSVVDAFRSRAIRMDVRLQVRAVEFWLRHVWRRDAVMAPARSGIKMRVVGTGWDCVDAFPNVERRPPTPYSDFLNLAGDARISLDVSTYRGGVNDRVFSYGLNGSIVFTNAGAHLATLNDGRGGIRFYSLANLRGLHEQIEDLLSRPQTLQQQSQIARDAVLAAHTWRHRLDLLLSNLAAIS